MQTGASRFTLQQQERILLTDKAIHGATCSVLTTLLFFCSQPFKYDKRKDDLVISPQRNLVLSIRVMLFAVLDDTTQPWFVSNI